GINTNVIGLPELTLDVQNNTNTTVEAIEFEADCFNKFDEPVIGLASGNRFSSHWKYAIPPGGRKQMSAQMSLFRTTAKADVWISRVKLGSGEVWTQTKDEAKKTPYGLAKARLMECGSSAGIARAAYAGAVMAKRKGRPKEPRPLNVTVEIRCSEDEFVERIARFLLALTDAGHEPERPATAAPAPSRRKPRRGR
ncbi:MAG: hypothetical protein ACK6EB_38350, partial [Planctomyces sp.]